MGQPDTNIIYVASTVNDPTEPDGLAARAAALVALAAAEGVKIGRGTIARELGINESQARQLLRQAERAERAERARCRTNRIRAPWRSLAGSRRCR